MPRHGNKFCLGRLLEQRSREMTVIPVYPATLLRLDFFSEEMDGSTTVNVVLNIWMCICMHRQSFTRSTNTLIREHLVLPARRSRTRSALCRYAYVRKNLISRCFFPYRAKRRHDRGYFFSSLPPPLLSYMRRKR